MATESEFDLYDDLDDAFIQPLDKHVEQKKVEEQEKVQAQQESLNKLKQQEKECQELKQSNEQLQYNMSMLTVTARNEVER